MKDVRGDAMAFRQTEWRYTTKPGKLYITFFVEPRAPFVLPGDERTPCHARITWAATRGRVPVKFRTENGRAVLDIERPIPDPMASVVVVEVLRHEDRTD
jgi:hypothetical protein